MADALGLPAFGEIWVAGVAAKAKCEFRQVVRSLPPPPHPTPGGMAPSCNAVPC